MKEAADTLDLPPEFMRWNGRDPEWVSALPALLGRLAGRWSLELEPHFPEIAINYVAPATRLDGAGRRTRCVLKVSRHGAESANEIAALRLWDGRGAARVIEADAAVGALLIERVEPGTMLVDLAEADDEAATAAAASILRLLWAPEIEASDPRGLRPLESWCAAYDRNRDVLVRGVPGFPVTLFQRADALRRDLLQSTPHPSVLHGDMQHYNLLREAGGGWRAIDPKGLAGDRHFDVCQFLRNPRDRVTQSVNRRRLDIFCAELGLERQRAKDWCFVHAVLDACWEFEDAVPLAADGLSDEAKTPRASAPQRDPRWRPAIARAEAVLAL